MGELSSGRPKVAAQQRFKFLLFSTIISGFDYWPQVIA